MLDVMDRNDVDKARMLEHYFTRTVEHIHRVQKNVLYIVTKCATKLGLQEDEQRQLMWNVFMHDQSKFSETQFRPYVELTEFHYQRKVLGNTEYEYPEGVKELVDIAVTDHYYQENHHPERIPHDPDYALSILESIETVCDLQAMAQEFNEGSCRGFFENVWKKKQKENLVFNGIDQSEMVFGYMEQVVKCFEEGIENGEI